MKLAVGSGDAENTLDRSPVEPAGRTRIPAPATTTRIGTLTINIRCHHIGFDPIGFRRCRIKGMINRVEQLEAVPGLLGAALSCKGKHHPSRRMGILSAVFTYTRRISLDVTRIMRRTREGRREQADDARLLIDQMLHDGIHRLPRAAFLALAGENAPALAE